MKQDDFIVYEDFTLKQALEKINAAQGHQVIVIGKKSKVLGMLGDGDVRRAVLRGSLLSAPAVDFMTTSFISVQEKDQKKLRELFVECVISTIPVTNAAGQLKKIAVVSPPDYAVRIISFKSGKTT